MPLPVTGFFAAVLALWMMYLAFVVVRFRRRTDTSIGDGGDIVGARRIRGHANAVETVPIFLILMGLAEGFGVVGWALWVIGAAFTAGRILHGLHFMEVRGTITGRFHGMVLTVSGIATLALIDLWQSLTA